MPVNEIPWKIPGLLQSSDWEGACWCLPPCMLKDYRILLENLSLYLIPGWWKLLVALTSQFNPILWLDQHQRRALRSWPFRMVRKPNHLAQSSQPMAGESLRSTHLAMWREESQCSFRAMGKRPSHYLAWGELYPLPLRSEGHEVFLLSSEEGAYARAVCQFQEDLWWKTQGRRDTVPGGAIIINELPFHGRQDIDIGHVIWPPIQRWRLKEMTYC